MAFHENPIIDKNSERSEESVLQMKSIFTRKAGFITREEIPDYGVDLNVELISSQGATSKGATSNNFAVQIKSTAQVKIIRLNRTEYISIEFKTSRLGHLCRRPPAYGIITVYDETSKVAYYDLVEEIVYRLINHRGNEEWKAQEKVNILIPFLNVLNSKAASTIHHKMMIRFNDLNILLHAYGNLYRIPSLIAKSNDEGIDFNDLKQVEKLLKEHGLGLFNSKDFDMVLNLIGRLSSTTIIRSKELVLLAAITFGQTGMTIECNYYLQRSRSYYEDFSMDEKFMLDYTTLMVRFKMGEIDNSQFKKGLVALKKQSASTINALTLDINLIYTKFMERGRDDDNNLLGAIGEVFLKIEKSDLAVRDKVMLKLFNLENLHNYGTGLYLKDAGKYKIQEKLGIYIPQQERIERVRQILNVLQAAAEEVHNILKETLQSGDKLIIAFASYYKARFFFMMRFHTMMLTIDKPTQSDENQTKLYENTLNFCYQSVALFFGLSMWHEAHQSLCCAYDIQILYRVLHKSDVGSKTLAELEETLRKIESETGLRRYESIVESTFNSLSTEDKSSERNWANVPDDQVEVYAQILLDAYSIPKERLVHIIADINAHKTFYRECSNPDLELLQDLTHLQQKETTYATPPIFVVRSKKSGIQSKRSSNINELLDQFGSILKR
jgi:hypothetical protein